MIEATPTRICRACAVEHQVQRKKRDYVVAICPVCLEYHALFKVIKDQPNQGDKRAQDLIALRQYDRVLARGGE